MKQIAVIGAGAVGSFYGAKIASAGYRVKFLMRRDYQAVKCSGLSIRSIWGDFHLKAEVYERPEDIGPADLVICALKTTSLDAARPLLAPVVGPDTKIVALMNGLGVEEKLAEWFDPGQILGALAFTCINRLEPGHVHHLDYGHVLISHMRGDMGLIEEVAGIFRKGGIPTDTCESIKRARWQKLCWNIPYNTLSITAGGVTTDQIMADPGLRRMVDLLMAEVMAAAEADNASLPPSVPAQMVENTRKMKPYKTSMTIDFANRQPLELEYILGEPIRRAEAAGVQVPYMKSQYWLASFLDRLNQAKCPPTRSAGKPAVS
jgi:2-dehydropantoate 2-reductase